MFKRCIRILVLFLVTLAFDIEMRQGGQGPIQFACVTRGTVALQDCESRARLLAMKQALQHGIQVARAPEVHQARVWRGAAEHVPGRCQELQARQRVSVALMLGTPDRARPP